MSKIKVGLLYYTTDRPWGGVNTFFRNFKRYISLDGGIELVNQFAKADILLSVGHYIGPGSILKKRHLRNLSHGLRIRNPLGWFLDKGIKKIVFRLDGLRRIYAPEGSKLDDILIDNLDLADSAIFQSNYSRECFHNLNIQYPRSNTVILNGTDNRIFYPPNCMPDFSNRVVLVTNSWSKNHNKGFKTIALFSELNRVQVLHIGNWPEDISPRRVKLLGTMQENEVAEVLKKGQYFLFPSENEACPNTVVEALACGLPVLYHDSGGTPELCKNDLFGKALPKDPYDILALNQFIENVLGQYRNMRSHIMEQIKLFNFEYCYNQYKEHFEKFLS